MDNSLKETAEVRSIPYDIYIVGTGIIPAFHLTRESENAIRNSNEVLYVDKSFGISEVLQNLCPKATDIAATSYKEGTRRIDSYRLMAARVIEAALDHPPVTFALYGHPLIYSLPPFIVIAAAEAMGLRVKTMAGISSLDTLFIDLNIDPCTQGIQMYEATDLLLRERPIQPDVPCIIWQVGTVESRLYSEMGSKPERFAKFRDYLLRFYSPKAIVRAVYSSNIPLAPSSVKEFPISELESYSDSLHQGVTLYIHPETSRPIANIDLRVSMDELEHLEEVSTSI
jgi:uncharacterized protein YabN with tetrapyrrole methylase and pyrophosphatase domain